MSSNPFVTNNYVDVDADIKRCCSTFTLMLMQMLNESHISLSLSSFTIAIHGPQQHCRTGAYIVGVVAHSYLATRLPLWLTLSSYASTTPVVLAVRDASTGEGARDVARADPTEQELGNWDVARVDPTEQELENCDVTRADPTEQELGNWDVARVDPTEQELENYDSDFRQGQT
ncbi:hypothetical protein GW17_00006590 [Ensete ventricosum]|nr:hypothetical protein GW17_00006590 [Ensete ventricosum]